MEYEKPVLVVSSVPSESLGVVIQQQTAETSEKVTWHVNEGRQRCLLKRSPSIDTEHGEPRKRVSKGQCTRAWKRSDSIVPRQHQHQ
jgi:hypothetical protein